MPHHPTHPEPDPRTRPGHSFQYDPFQREAIALIDHERSLLISAPTGAGKTVIAEYAIEQAMARRERAVYTAPIKALSNQKYRDFHERYGDAVGILTGDVSINPDAPLLIMTTEIYRNTLFEDHTRIENVRWVIFDEVHYLDDRERGTVWEEALLFSPPHIRILALSATIPNAQQLADWIGSLHGEPMRVITEDHRPVPLIQHYQAQNHIFTSKVELKKQGYLGHEDWSRWRHQQLSRSGSYGRHGGRGGRGGRGRFHGGGRRGGERPGGGFARPDYGRPNRVDSLMLHLTSEEQLPCLYFAFGRRRAEELAWDHVKHDLLTPDERTAMHRLYQELCAKYQLKDNRTAYELEELILRGVAYHHAGMLPTLKEVVEQLFTSRLIKLIFTTETFALGINMPARSVVFDDMMKNEGRRFRPLTTREFYQMAGRAGRRGIDDVGYVYARVNPNRLSYPELIDIIHGRPEPVMSRFNLAYATILNLFRKHGEALLDIYPRSFHAFQSPPKQRDIIRQMLERKILLLRELGYIREHTLTDKGEFASGLFGYELPLGELYDEGLLHALNDVELACVLSALVYEPRKVDQAPRFPKWVKRLDADCQRVHRDIHKLEKRLRLEPLTRKPAFHLATALHAWMHGASFEKTDTLTEVDDGEMVRVFRMTVQLLRELAHTQGLPNDVRDIAHKARQRINRDVVDAEAQLRTA